MFEPGTVLGQKYRVDRVLGRGGMGIVVAATHVQLGTPVALKFLSAKTMESASLVERFLREARAAAQLKSEHICRVHDVCVVDGTPCLVMEQLVGTDLGKLLRRRKRFSPAEATDILMQALAGVGEAHAAQIVHRDLKPGNLFITTRPDGSQLVKVLDFGIAKARTQTSTELTQSDTILGSPSYMSLEQLRSSKLVDQRSDIWSLGVILFELVAGHRPFSGESVADLALKIAFEPTPRLPDGPAALDAVITRCLAKSLPERYQDVAELAVALEPFADVARGSSSSITRVVRGLASGPVIAIPVDESPATIASADVAEIPTTLRSGAGARVPAPSSVTKLRSSRGVVSAVVAFAIVGGVGGGYALTRGGDPPPAAIVESVKSPAPPPPIEPAAIPIDAAVVAEPVVEPAIAAPAPVIPKPTPRPPRPKPTPPPRTKANDKDKDVGESRI